MDTAVVRDDRAVPPTPEAVARRRLSAAHLKELHEGSGLSWETIVRESLHTISDAKQLNQILARKDGQELGECLAFPYPGVVGDGRAEYVRVKPTNPPLGKKNKKPCKYLSPVGAAVRLYMPRTCAELYQNTNLPLIVVEGEKKALAVAQLGYPAIGLAGVDCWSNPRSKDAWGRGQGDRVLHTDFGFAHLDRRLVFIVFDSDAASNRRVFAAELRLARALAVRGAFVGIVRIPAPLEGKHGIDDFLVRQSDPAAAFKQLTSTATDFQVNKLRNESGQYQVVDGRIVRMSLRNDTVNEIPLCNFDARIVEEVVRDDGGGDPRAEYCIEGRLQGNETTLAVHVPATAFDDMAWPSTYWGARAIVAAGFGNKDHLRAAIQHLSSPSRRTVYTHLGWSKIGDHWVYLHAGGAIGAHGPVPGVECDPPRPLLNFILPEPPTGEALRAAVRTALKLLDGRVRDHIVFPLVAAVYRAPLGAGDFGAFLAGPTGTFKSEVSALAEQHFGPGMDARHLPANWASTGNALEAIAFSAKDALLVVDDFAPSGTSADVQRMHREAERLFRAQGNNSGRVRMAADTSLRQERPPRGLILSTGEDVPRGHSIRARLVIIEVAKGDIPVAALTEFQKAAGAGTYALAMAAYIRHLAADYDRVVAAVTARRATLRDEFAAAAQHARTPSAFADLAIGLEAFLDFAVACEAITTTERATLWTRGRRAFGRLIGEQADQLAAADPVDQYVRLVQTAIASGRAHLAGPNGRAPSCDPQKYGWRLRPASPSQNAEPDWAPQGSRIGWLDAAGNSVFLDPDGTFAEVQRLAAEQHQTLPVTPNTLQCRLHEKGLLARVERTADKTRFCVRQTLDGVRRKVLCFAAPTLFPTEGAPSAPPDAEPAFSPTDGRHPETADPPVEGPKCATGTLAQAPVRPAEFRATPTTATPAAHSAHPKPTTTTPEENGEWTEYQ